MGVSVPGLTGYLPQVDRSRSELEVTIAYLRRQEANERRACEEEVAARDAELSETEARLRDEQRDYQRAEFGRVEGGGGGPVLMKLSALHNLCAADQVLYL